MPVYRLSKYNPKNRNRNGKYLISEWTSYSDIGKKYDGIVFTRNQYFFTERMYIKALKYLSLLFNVNYFVLKDLEFYFSIFEINKMLSSKKLLLNNKDLNFLSNIQESETISIQDFETCIKLMLREVFWCNLYDKDNSIRIWSGYDYIIYIDCPVIETKHIYYLERIGIFIEEMNGSNSNSKLK